MWHIISTDDWQAEDELPTPDDSMERAILRYGVKKSIEDELDAPSVYVRHSGVIQFWSYIHRGRARRAVRLRAP